MREYFENITDVLNDFGGSAATVDVCDEVYLRMKKDNILQEKDETRHSSGQIRWYNFARAAYQVMVKAGLSKYNTPRGTWALTKQ